jgi:hypothetical protein
MEVGWIYLLGVGVTLWAARQSRRWLYASGLLLSGAFIFIAGDGTRAPFLWALVYLLVLGSFLRPISYRAVGLTMIAVMVGAFAIGALSPKLRFVFASENPVETVWYRLTSRIFIGNGGNTVRSIELVRSGSWEHRLGNVHVTSFLNMVPGVSTEPFARELFLTVNPGSRATTYSSTTYLGQVFVDFGLAGCVLIFAMLGGLFAWVQMLLLRLPKTPLLLPLAAFIVLILGRVSLSGPTAVISTLAVAIPLMVTARLAYSAVRWTSGLQGRRS